MIFAAGSMPMPKSAEHHQSTRSEWAVRLSYSIVVYALAVLVTVPLFIVIHPHLPELLLPIGSGMRVDHILVFVLLIAAALVVMERMRAVLQWMSLAGLLALVASSFLGSYGVGALYRDYADLLERLRASTGQVPMAAHQYRPFMHADRLRALIVGNDPVVRKEAVRMATANFSKVQVGPDEFTLVQSFSIFKEVNSRWRYVSDVKGAEYFAPPAESLELMAGDCDDHAVLLAALIKSIGGQVRLVRTEGHVYPELRVGDDHKMERAAHLIRKVLFTKEVGDAPLYHHTDADGIHWINIDYTRNYPGGELMHERIIGILEV